jgi:hypothetical protein
MNPFQKILFGTTSLSISAPRAEATFEKPYQRPQNNNRYWILIECVISINIVVTPT